jgi:hypothetical protein
MGQASYFAFGNSNSLSTIDIRGGYTGMSGILHFSNMQKGWTITMKL